MAIYSLVHREDPTQLISRWKSRSRSITICLDNEDSCAIARDPCGWLDAEPAPQQTGTGTAPVASTQQGEEP